MPLLSNYSDGFFNVGADCGFLPLKAPLETLPERYQALQVILDAMPVVIEGNKNGLLHTPDAIVAPVLALPNFIDIVSAETDVFVIQALFRSYGFLTSAYLLEPSFQQFRKDGSYGKARNFLPANIAQPFCKVAEKLQVFPWLDYHYAYSLGNYRKLNADGDLNWENVTMCNRFSGQPDEVGFIMLHVDINRFSAGLVGTVMQTIQQLQQTDATVSSLLAKNWQTMKQMNLRRKEMWKASRWQHYNDFRIFIMGVKGNEALFGEGVTYEKVWDEPKAFRGQTGAQDDIIPMQDIFSGVIFYYPENELTKYLLDLRLYRPKCIQSFFIDLEGSVKALHPKGLMGKLVDNKDITGLCYLLGILEEIYHFRNGHWQFVQKYIMANTKYATATGGTPITSWIPNQILSVISQMEDVIKALHTLPVAEDEQALILFRKNDETLPTKKGLIEGQLELVRKNNFSAEAVFALNEKFGYNDQHD
ncbi:indoleamine 2,3-dioxygenase [Ferruginibacter lapsinanis]|uniref:indoleamine 2,3-dioxygenase n=1 Tax=Ferruginibacter lapsinanis TaxID=563172 RepID=UPI001E2C9FEC|nr:indoleamine 2,3-dioxygenase [Ferruginibacter lapsinanis]UEG49741.1 indoleamine 2,3-dioxygenase [Ferruginibacter lapsinanis]